MPVVQKAALQVVVKSIARTRVLSLREVVADYQSQGPLWMRVVGTTRGNRIPPSHDKASACFAVFHDREYKQHDVDTEVCMPIGDNVTIPPAALKELKLYDVPELPRAATVIHNGSYDGLVGVYNQLFGWIGASGETVCGPVREIYHVGMDQNNMNKDKLVTEIVVPLA